MKRYGLIILSLLACIFATSFADNIVSVQISGNWLVIGTPGAVSLGTISNWWGTLSHTFSWDEYFWIRDLRWFYTWHYTTIQCDWLYQAGWNWVITWVLFKSTAGTLLWWLANGTTINSALQQWDGADITEPKLYFYRNDGWHSGWVTNIYIDYPTISVTVPAGTPAWTYRWAITYTLYDTSFNYTE